MKAGAEWLPTIWAYHSRSKARLETRSWGETTRIVKYVPQEKAK